MSACSGCIGCCHGSWTFGSRIHVEGFTPEIVDPVPEQEKNAFLKACKAGDYEQVKAYCEKYPTSVNVQDEHGKSGLMLAARSGAFKVVEYLTSVPGYKIEMEDENWENALFDAAAANSAKIVALLLNKRIPVVINKKRQYAENVLNTNTPSKAMQRLLWEAVDMQYNRENAVLGRLLKLVSQNKEKRQEYIKQAEQTIGRKFEKETNTDMRELADPDRKEAKKKVREAQQAVLDDKATQRKIVEYFRANPPESIEAARKIVYDRFGIRPSLESLETLLKWGNVAMKKSTLDEVD